MGLSCSVRQLRISMIQARYNVDILED